jgi:dihydrofolate reductase
MRKIITGAFVSLDGVMQAPGGSEEDPSGGFRYGGWVAPLADEAFGEEVDKLFAGPFDLLLGRKTYEIFAAYWPFKEGAEYAGIARSFNAATKYVATRSDMALTWDRSERLKDAAADVPRLKREDGPPLVTQGSSDLIQTLLAHDLIDELRVFTFPVTLGRGKKLFGDGVKPAAFKLAHSRVSPNGIVIATYARAGELKTADIDLDPPAPAEVARRDKMKGER